MLWGIVFYAFAVLLVPMERELGLSTAQLTGAFSLALLISAVAVVAVGRYLDHHGALSVDTRRSPRAPRVSSFRPETLSATSATRQG